MTLILGQGHHHGRLYFVGVMVRSLPVGAIVGVTWAVLAFLLSPSISLASSLLEPPPIFPPAEFPGQLNGCQIPQSPFEITPFVCCSGKLGDSTALGGPDSMEGVWRPPHDPYPNESRGGCVKPRSPQDGSTWYYDAYRFTAKQGYSWVFSTCGYRLTYGGAYQCRYVYNDSLAPAPGKVTDTFSPSLYIYKAPFVPSVPCKNLVKMCAYGSACNGVQFTASSTGEYVFVISSYTSKEESKRRQDAGSAMGFYEAYKGPYEFYAQTSDPQRLSQTSMCQTGRVPGNSSYSVTCDASITQLDNSSKGLPTLWTRSPGKTCEIWLKGQTIYYDAYPFQIDASQANTEWLFSLCGSTSKRLIMVLYRGNFTPDQTACATNNIIGQQAYYGNCADSWFGGMIETRLGVGSYTLVVANLDGQWCPDGGPVGKPYKLTVNWSPPSGVADPGNMFSCNSQTIQPTGPRCASDPPSIPLKCTLTMHQSPVQYQGNQFYCMNIMLAICGGYHPGNKWGPNLELEVPWRISLRGKVSNIVTMDRLDAGTWTRCMMCGAFGFRNFCGTNCLQNLAGAHKLYNDPEDPVPNWVKGGFLDILSHSGDPRRVGFWADAGSKQDKVELKKWHAEVYTQWTRSPDGANGTYPMVALLGHGGPSEVTLVGHIDGDIGLCAGGGPCVPYR